MYTVSVIMPCHNHGTFLAESIEGILNQSYSDLELIIIDDFSNDNSLEIIEKYKTLDARVCSIRHEENMGASRSRNDGINFARGEYIAFCDADDIWMPEKLTIQMEQFANNPSYGVVYCDSIIVDENGLPKGQRFSSIYNKTKKRSGNIFVDLCITNFINAQTVVLKKSCLVDLPLFGEQIKWVEDWQFWISLAWRHTFLYIDRVLAKYRVHSQSTAVVRQREKIINSAKVYTKILKDYPDISLEQRSRILYQIGIAYAELGKRKASNNLFLRSFLTDKKNIKSFCRLFISKPRLLFPADHNG